MQSLDVISINLWQILISLCNLLILFLILKKFLYQPVKKVIKERQDSIDTQYAQAAAAEQAALARKNEWEEKMASTRTDAGLILETAQQQAECLSEHILSEAKAKAEDMIQAAKFQAALDQKKAKAEIKKEAADISALLAGKILEREISPDDHKALINSVITEIGDNHD